ncbi:MAG: type II toxin-antitoxin system RelE/ParE family toxin [Nitrosomonadales bacterium]|nr:type II toxin-antitoxin system RelE/ParE family toxin [Nitrosomonadales bacterium]
MPPKPVRVSLSAEAQADADAVVDWYIGEGAFIAAEDFTEELDGAIDLLNQFAALGESGMHHTRSLPLHGFPYSLIYRLRDDTARVIAVAHHSRRPGYWVGRR